MKPLSLLILFLSLNAYANDWLPTSGFLQYSKTQHTLKFRGNKQQAFNYELAPNTAFYGGVSFKWKHITFGASLPLGEREDESINGKSKSLILNSHFSFGAHEFFLFFTKFKSFYLRSGLDSFGETLVLPNLKSQNFGVKYRYYLKKKFRTGSQSDSFLFQTIKDKNFSSHQSLYLGAILDRTTFDGIDRALLISRLGTNTPFSFDSAKLTTLATELGWVGFMTLNKFFFEIKGALGPGLQYQKSILSNNESKSTKSVLHTSLAANTGLAFSKRVIGGVSFQVHNTSSTIAGQVVDSSIQIVGMYFRFLF